MIGVYQTKGVKLSGPCGNKWSKHVSGEGGGLPLGPGPPDFYLCGSRDSEAMDATWWRVVSPHFGHTSAESGYQKRKHVVLFKNYTDTFSAVKC
jgi:hypothetical protein